MTALEAKRMLDKTADPRTGMWQVRLIPQPEEFDTEAEMEAFTEMMELKNETMRAVLRNVELRARIR